MTRVITYALASNPQTAPATLAWLARQPDLTHDEAFALAGNPLLPDDADLNAPPFLLYDVEELDTRALAALTPERRQQMLANSPHGAVLHVIAEHGVFTPAEIARCYRTNPPPTLAAHLVYLRNPNTPRDLAELSIRAASTLHHRGQENDRESLIIEAAAVRHRIAHPTTRTAHALRTQDPDAYYAQAITDQDAVNLATGTYVRDMAAWWAAILAVHPHPDVIAAALQVATDADDTTTSGRILRRRIAAEILASYRTSAQDRYSAALLHRREEERLASYAATAPEEHLASFLTHPHALDGIARNPNASAATLRAAHGALTKLAKSTSTKYDALRERAHTHITTHPNTDRALRTSTPVSTRSPLAHHLQRTGGDPQALLGAPARTLTHPELFTHARHWAALAYSAHHGAPITPEGAQALRTLESAHFPGTFRQLLTTAASITR